MILIIKSVIDQTKNTRRFENKFVMSHETVATDKGLVAEKI